MSKLFEEMAQGTAEARAYMEAKDTKLLLPETVDVRRIRKRLRLSQNRFAERFGFSVDTVRHWESGRRLPLLALFSFSSLLTSGLLYVPSGKSHVVRDFQELSPHLGSAYTNVQAWP
jgi:putative transcriptional regulator